MSFFNQYSLIVVAGSGALVFGAVLWCWHSLPLLLRAALWLAYIIGALLIAFSVRYPLEDTPQTAAEVEALLNNGQPTFLMLYSNY